MKFLSSINDDQILFSLELIKSHVHELKEHLKCKLYEHPEDFLILPRESIDKKIAIDTSARNSNLKYIFVAGIGGATNTLKALINALGQGRKVLIFDTLNGDSAKDLLQILDNINNKNEFIFLVISKSGRTLETNLNAKVVAGILEEKFGDSSDRTIVLTLGDSELWRDSLENVAKIPLRANISDRYSAFSIVGLLPLALAGIDINKFLDGAEDVLKRFETDEMFFVRSAAISDYMFRSGKIIRNFFFFNSGLEELGKWTRQLISESLGKKGIGIFPAVSMGPEDLHSIAQLILDGPDNIFNTFISIESETGGEVNNSMIFGLLEPELAGKKINEVKVEIYNGFLESMSNLKKPFTQIILRDLSSFSLGQYMQFMMIETALLGLAWGIDPFNQPAVEEYKQKSRQALQL